MIKYCDACKWDDSLSYNPEDCNEKGELVACPACGKELFEAETREDIP